MGKRGQKTCPECSTPTGARAFECKKCHYAFSTESKKKTTEKPKTGLGPGLKLCPTCQKTIGINSCSCKYCNHIFKVRKTAPPAKKTGLGMGLKPCPDCQKPIGGNSYACKHCGKIFREKKVIDKPVKELKKGRGAKTCLKCKTLNGLRRKVCTNCGYEFEVKNGNEEVVSPEKRKLLAQINAFPMPRLIKMSPTEHAKRILSYGKERATRLLKLAKWGKRWFHVDWDVVEQGLIELV